MFDFVNPVLALWWLIDQGGKLGRDELRCMAMPQAVEGNLWHAHQVRDTSLGACGLPSMSGNTSASFGAFPSPSAMRIAATMAINNHADTLIEQTFSDSISCYCKKPDRMANTTAGLLSAKEGLNCRRTSDSLSTGKNSTRDRLGRSASFVLDHICGQACRRTLFGRNALAIKYRAPWRSPVRAARNFSGSTGGTSDGSGARPPPIIKLVAVFSLSSL